MDGPASWRMDLKMSALESSKAVEGTERGWKMLNRSVPDAPRNRAARVPVSGERPQGN